MIYFLKIQVIKSSYLQDYETVHILNKVQERYIGQYFGANNHWITNPPDIHPCMPGIPDDLS